MWNLQWHAQGRMRRQGDAGSRRDSEYAERDRILRSMGYKSYREYLSSPLWREIRKRVLTGRRGGRRACSMCKKIAGQVHHDRYTRENLSGDSLEHLRPTCGKCHKTVEFKSKKKLQPDQVRRRLRRKERRKRQLRERRERKTEERIEELEMGQEFQRLAKSF